MSRSLPLLPPWLRDPIAAAGRTVRRFVRRYTGALGGRALLLLTGHWWVVSSGMPPPAAIAWTHATLGSPRDRASDDRPQRGLLGRPNAVRQRGRQRADCDIGDRAAVRKRPTAHAALGTATAAVAEVPIIVLAPHRSPADVLYAVFRFAPACFLRVPAAAGATASVSPARASHSVRRLSLLGALCACTWSPTGAATMSDGDSWHGFANELRASAIEAGRNQLGPIVLLADSVTEAVASLPKSMVDAACLVALDHGDASIPNAPSAPGADALSSTVRLCSHLANVLRVRYG